LASPVTILVCLLVIMAPRSAVLPSLAAYFPSPRPVIK
jgi:hypothetical protein